MVSLVKASAGMTARVVSIVALATKPRLAPLGRNVESFFDGRGRGGFSCAFRVPLEKWGLIEGAGDNKGSLEKGENSWFGDLGTPVAYGVEAPDF